MLVDAVIFCVCRGLYLLSSPAASKTSEPYIEYYYYISFLCIFIFYLSLCKGFHWGDTAQHPSNRRHWVIVKMHCQSHYKNSTLIISVTVRGHFANAVVLWLPLQRQYKFIDFEHYFRDESIHASSGIEQSHCDILHNKSGIPDLRLLMFGNTEKWSPFQIWWNIYSES